MNPIHLKRGFLTSERVGDQLQSVAETVNRIIREKNNILADKTMTRAQRTPALDKLQKEADRSLTKALGALESELANRIEQHEKAVKGLLHGKLSTVEVVQLAKELKSMNSSDRMSAIAYSADLARAAVLAPKALSGFEEGELGIQVFLNHHAPDVLEASDQLDHDVRSYQSVQNHCREGLISLMNDGDPSALKTIYKPKLDAIDHTPRTGESSAQYKERTGHWAGEPDTGEAAE